MISENDNVKELGINIVLSYSSSFRIFGKAFKERIVFMLFLCFSVKYDNIQHTSTIISISSLKLNKALITKSNI